MPWGCVSGKRLAKGGRSQSPHPQTPITRVALLEDRHLRPAVPNTRPCVLLASGALAPAKWKFKRCAVEMTPPTLA